MKSNVPPEDPSDPFSAPQDQQGEPPMLLRQALELLESSSAIYYGLDTNWRFTYLNRRAEALWTKTREQLIGTNIWETFPQSVQTQSYDEMHRALAEQRAIRFESYSSLLGFWVEVEVYPTATGLGVYVHDITKRRQVEAAQHASELRYRRLFEAARDGILILDAETGQIVDVNPYLIDLLGYSYENLLGKKVWEIDSFGNLVASQDSFRGLVETGYARYEDLPLETRDGRLIPVEFVSNVYAADGKNVIQCNIRDISERKQAEQAQRESEQKFRRFFEESSEGIVLTDKQGMITEWNLSQEQITGLPRTQVLGQPMWEVQYRLAPDARRAEMSPTRYRDGMVDFLRADGASMASFTMDGEVQRADGTIRVVQMVIFSIPTDKGNFGASITRDVTEYRRAQQALAEERSLLRAVIDNIPDTIYTKDAEGRFLLKNAADLHLMGAHSADEVVGKTDFDYYPHDLAEAYTEADQQVINSGQPLLNREEMTVDSEGNPRWLLTSKVPLRDSHNHVIGLVGIGRDITERKKSELEVRKLYRAIEQSASSVIITDLRGRIEYVNPHFTQVTGYSAEEVIGKNPRILQSGETPREVYTQLWETILAGSEWRGEFHNRNKSGDLFWELASISPIKDSDGQITHLLAVKEDITERKQAEAKLAKLNRTLAVLSEVNQAIVRLRVASELFEKACRIAVDLGGFRMAWIGLLDPETTRVNPVAYAGITEDYLEKLGVVLRDGLRGHGPAGSALRAGEHVIINDLEHDSRMAPWREDALKLGYRAVAAFPLIVAGEARGVFNLYADQPDFFDDQEAQLLDEMAEDLSFALEFAEQEAQRREAETALERHVQALEAMHLFLQTTLDAFPGHTVVLDPDGTIISANASWARFADENSAFAPRYYLGMNYLAVCDTAAGPWSDEAAPTAAGIRAVIDARQDEFYLEYPCHSPSERRWFMLRVTPFPEPAPRRVVVAHINVTERRLAEEVIRALNTDLEGRVVERTAQYVSAKERAEAILNSSTDAIVLCRPDGTIGQANPAFDLILGHRSDELVNQQLTSLAIPQDAARQAYAFRAVLESELPQRLEITVQQYDGGTFDADMTLSPVIGQEGTLTGVVCVLRDISERKQMEDDLRKALAHEKELSELKTRFTSMVSHDIRTPLAVISSSTELLRTYYPRMSEETKVRHFERIGSQVERMVELLTDVLTISRADAGSTPFNPVNLDLDQYCRTLIEEYQNNPKMKHRLVYASPGEPVTAQVDERLLYQSLTNLLNNAIKYSPEGSPIRFDLSLDANDAIFTIADSGIGIPESDLPHLFEPFQRASNVGEIEGTGLGLAIVKRSIEAHGGTITCESQVGVGTTFIVKIPRGGSESNAHDDNPGREDETMLR